MSEAGDRTPQAREWNQTFRWVAGAGLVALGVALLMESWGTILSRQQHAGFVMIPALAGFAAAAFAYQRNGQRVTRGVRSGVTAGVLITVVAAFYYFGFDWAQAWPVFLILLGIGVLVESFWRR